MAQGDVYLIVIPSLTLGGAERQAFAYARAIRDLGIGRPIVIGLGRFGELVPALEQEGISFHTIAAQAFITGNRTQKLLALLRWAWALRKLRPHTIIGFTHWPNVLCGLAWRWTGAKRCFWNQRSVDEGLGLTLWERWAMRSRPQYLSNGMAGAQFIAQRHSVALQEVTIIPNAVALPETSNREGRTGPLQLLMVANFFPEKDHATVLRAMALYLQRQDAHPVHLHLVGAAPGSSSGLAECKALAFDLGLHGHVTFHGTVKDVGPLLQKADIGILSTRSEGVSNAVLEYMAHALPVIATDILANREALGEQNAKWLFPVGNAERLADLLAALIAHPERTAIGQRNRAYVEGRHALAIFDRCLKEVLSTPGSNRSV